MRFLWFNLPSIKVWSKKRIVVKSLSFTTNLLLQVFLLPDFTVMLNVKWWCWYDSWAEVGDVPTDTWPPLKEISSRNHSFKGRMNLVFTARSSPMTRCIWICKWPKRKIKAHENDEKKKIGVNEVATPFQQLSKEATRLDRLPSSFRKNQSKTNTTSFLCKEDIYFKLQDKSLIWRPHLIAIALIKLATLAVSSLFYTDIFANR